MLSFAASDCLGASTEPTDIPVICQVYDKDVAVVALFKSFFLIIKRLQSSNLTGHWAFSYFLSFSTHSSATSNECFKEVHHSLMFPCKAGLLCSLRQTTLNAQNYQDVMQLFWIVMITQPSWLVGNRTQAYKCRYCLDKSLLLTKSLVPMIVSNSCLSLDLRMSNGVQPRSLKLLQPGHVLLFMALGCPLCFLI